MAPELPPFRELTESGVATSDAAERSLLDVLNDPASRKILAATDERGLSAREIADTVDLPLSTVYRKLDRLADPPLVEQRYRLETDGKHTSEYRSVVSDIRLTVGTKSGDTVTHTLLDSEQV
ncbi:MAG: ArsR/SmtB family transcription factor [Halobacteriaceae archaeon]